MLLTCCLLSAFFIGYCLHGNGFARESRPNILLIVADDLGYSDLGCYGGEIETPNLDRLAKNGLRLSQFYTTGRCCPSRASILTGQYPHRVGLGHMTKDIGQLGYRGRISNEVQTVAQQLGESGYRCFLAGKWHLGTDDPTRHGFEEFYGTLVSAKTFWDANHFLRLPEGSKPRTYKKGEFYATDALADHAIDFLRQAGETSEKPWFLYLAFNAPHFPLHAPKETIAKYTGAYDKGWDALREDRFKKMKELGMVSADLQLPPRSSYYDWGESDGVDNPGWSSLTLNRREDLARRMAIYAAMVDRMDENIGRVIAELIRTKQFENTLIVFTSDNGACAEWDAFGFDLKSGTNNVLHRGEQIEQMGSADTYHSVGSGWANASNAPWRLYKHFNHEGGIAVPCILHWPTRGKSGGSIDATPSHLIDLVPTMRDAATTGNLLSEPETSEKTTNNRVASFPGRSLLPLFSGQPIDERTLFFEHEGNRAVRQGNWKLVALRNRDWELYDIAADRTELQNLASKHPDVVKQLSILWDAWAKENHVTPSPKDYGVQYIPSDDDASNLAKIFRARGFSLDSIDLPKTDGSFPAEQLTKPRFQSVAKFDWFPEGPSYRPSDNSYFFSGTKALTRLNGKGETKEILTQFGGGGTHFLPDGSVLIVGKSGLKRMFPDGRIALLADGEKIGAGNDISIGIHKEIYFSVPKEGIYRLTSGDNGKLEKMTDQGCNGLEVDLTGSYLYVVRKNVERYTIDIASSSFGEPETVFTFPKGQGGGDGCTFDAWGNLYTMNFRTGVIRVIDPKKKALIAEMPVGVVPASNMTFGGLDNSELFVTAGSPRMKNCQVLKADLGITGFCGHQGSANYPEMRTLSERGNRQAFSGK